MDWLSFIANMVGSLAWPTFLLIAILLLRKPIGHLLSFLQRLKYKEFEMEFGQRVGEVKEEVARELPTQGEEALPLPEIETFVRLGDLSPRSIIMQTWIAVEQAGLKAANRLGGVQFHGPGQTFQAIRFLESSEKLDRNVVSLLRDLRGLRNEAAHAPEFALSKNAALEYASSALAVARYLRQVASAA